MGNNISSSSPLQDRNGTLHGPRRQDLAILNLAHDGPNWFPIPTKLVKGTTPLRFDVASYVRGSPGREGSARALLARSLIQNRHCLRNLHRDRDGIGTTKTLRGGSER